MRTYRDLIYLMPKYSRAYKNFKKGDIKPSVVWLFIQEKSGAYKIVSPNDPKYLDYKIIKLEPVSSPYRKGGQGALSIVIKEPKEKEA